MSFREGPTIRLLEAQPGPSAGSRRGAGRSGHRPCRRAHGPAPCGRLGPVDRPWRPADQLALLVIEGILSRTVTLAGRSVVELLGDEDVIRPWDNYLEPTSVLAEDTWTALRPTRLAVLDASFAARIGPWPDDRSSHC